MIFQIEGETPSPLFKREKGDGEDCLHGLLRNQNEPPPTLREPPPLREREELLEDSFLVRVTLR